MKKVAIIGYGHVGKSIHELFPNAVIFDPNISEYTNTKDEINKTCELAIICVWTGMKPDGSCDTSIVESSIAWLKTPLILIKSTVTPGTTNALSKKYKKNICMSPEYFGEFSYWIPEQWTVKGWPFMIVGGQEDLAQRVLNIFLPVLGPNKKYYICSSLEAEIIKYMENAYLATKVTFANEMYEIVNKLGANWYKVWEGWALDPRVERSHSAVFPEKRGFSGKCLDKDITSLIKTAQSVDYDAKLLKQVLKSNNSFLKLNKAKTKKS